MSCFVILISDVLDYNDTTGSYVYMPDDDEFCVTIPITDDNDAEQPENFNVQFSFSEPSIEPIFATVTILDDDQIGTLLIHITHITQYTQHTKQYN